MNATAVFLADERRAKRSALLHLVFWIVVLILAVALLCLFAFHLGDATGTARTNEAWMRKMAYRPAPPPTVDIFKGFGTRQCNEYGWAQRQSCISSVETAKKGHM